MATKIPDFDVDGVVYEFYDVDAVHTDQLADFLSQESIRDVIGNLFFPVGSVYMTASDTNPSTIFGGTWEAVEGRVIMGSDANHPLGSTGGHEDAIIPQHDHLIHLKTEYSDGHQHTIAADGEFVSIKGEAMNLRTDALPSGNLYKISATKNSGTFSKAAKTRISGSHRHAIDGSTSSEGESVIGANNMPYVAYHIWRRIA